MKRYLVALLSAAVLISATYVPVMAMMEEDDGAGVGLISSASHSEQSLLFEHLGERDPNFKTKSAACRSLGYRLLDPSYSENAESLQDYVRKRAIQRAMSDKALNATEYESRFDAAVDQELEDLGRKEYELKDGVDFGKEMCSEIGRLYNGMKLPEVSDEDDSVEDESQSGFSAEIAERLQKLKEVTRGDDSVAVASAPAPVNSSKRLIAEDATEAEINSLFPAVPRDKTIKEEVVSRLKSGSQSLWNSSTQQPRRLWKTVKQVKNIDVKKPMRKAVVAGTAKVIGWGVPVCGALGLAYVSGLGSDLSHVWGAASSLCGVGYELATVDWRLTLGACVYGGWRYKSQLWSLLKGRKDSNVYMAKIGPCEFYADFSKKTAKVKIGALKASTSVVASVEGEALVVTIPSHIVKLPEFQGYKALFGQGAISSFGMELSRASYDPHKLIFKKGDNVIMRSKKVRGNYKEIILEQTPVLVDSSNL